MRKKFDKVFGVVTAIAVAITTMATGCFVKYDTTSAGVTTDKRIRVDINGTDGRKDAYSLQYDNWILHSSNKSTETFGGVEFSISNGGTTGGQVKGANYKRLIKSDFSTPRLTMDGAIISDATSGGIIKLEIKGLSEGTHTLTTWHSFWDNVSGSSMSVVVDGEKKVSNIVAPTRVSDDDDAGIGFCEFTAKEGKTVTVLIVPEGNGTYDNAVLNAFEIDSVNPFTTISKPFPEDGEEHFEQEKGLSWKAGDGATSHDVYLGTDFDAVNNATTSSPEFMGNQTETTYKVSDLSHMQKYYWRVDEHSENGITKGEVMSFDVAHLAFPSAEGYGRFAKAGRGGRVIEVTNLNDSGEGSLRDAIENQKGPRIIVFKVGGVIELKSRLSIPADGGNVYVAGQTAPGDGITLTHYAFGIYYAKDVVIRHVRLRVGDVCDTSMDGMGMAGADHSIIDHCSISWTIDEGTSSRGAHNITFQHNIIAEALHDSVHYKDSDRTQTECHSFAGSISGNIGSFHHNLLVNCTGRNWSLAGGMEQDGVTYAGQLDIRNNVVYNFRDRTTDGGVKRVNFVNNYYKRGEVSKDMDIFSIDGDELNSGDMQMAYLSGNKLVKKDGTVVLDSDDDQWSKAKSKFNKESEVKSDKPFFESYVKTETADEAYESVLADVGANVPKQDYLDTRYIKETKEGTYTYKGSKKGLKGIIDSQKDVGGYPVFETVIAEADDDHDGMPNSWEEEHGLNPNNSEDRNGLQLSLEGYTNLEMYLNELANDELIWNPNPDFSQMPTPTPTPTGTGSTDTPQGVASATPTGSQSSEVNTATPTSGKTQGGTLTGSPTPSGAQGNVETISPTPSGTEESIVTTSPTPSGTEESIVTTSPTPSGTEGNIVTTSPTPSGTEGNKETISPTPSGTGGSLVTTSPTPSGTEGSTVTTSPNGNKKLIGDLDKSGKVNLKDAVNSLKIALGIETDITDLTLADVNDDKLLDLKDTVIVLRIALGIIK